MFNKIFLQSMFRCYFVASKRRTILNIQFISLSIKKPSLLYDKYISARKLKNDDFQLKVIQRFDILCDQLKESDNFFLFSLVG